MSKLLIIEDDPYVVDIYRKTFSQQNFEMDVATDGEEGILKTKEFKPNLILLDIMIPKLNGLEVLEKIKADPQTREIPVFVLTNLGDEQYVKQCIAMGAEGFMIKANFSLDQLVKEVNQKIG